MRTLTAYAIGIFLVLGLANFFGWEIGAPRLHGLNIFSAGFMLGALGMYLSAWVNGYRKVVSR
jgi:hypothetical protein